MSIEQLKKLLLEKSKGSLISTVGEDVTRDWFVTPALDLNRILSGSLYKSVQSGCHVVLCGPEASGKSSFMALLLADAQKKGYLPIIIDAEGNWDRSFISRWGIDPENVLIIPSLWIEDIMVELARLIEEGYEKMAIVVDSIGAIESRKLVDDGVAGDVKADQGTLQKKLKRMLKMLVGIAKFQDSVVFSAGHFYGNPTGYGSPEMLGGGKYYRLSADVIISLKKSAIYEFPEEKTVAKKGHIIGNSITAATLKNRKHPPFLEATVEIDYKKGVNEFAGLIDIAFDMGLIKTKGAGWYEFDKLNIKAQGKSNLINEVLVNHKKEFLEIVEEYLKTTGYSNINKDLELQEGKEDNTESITVYDPDKEDEKTELETVSKTKNKKGVK